MFTGYDRTPDGMLGDTDGAVGPSRGELSNTQPLFRKLSQNGKTVLVLAMSNCATGLDIEHCGVDTTSTP